MIYSEYEYNFRVVNLNNVKNYITSHKISLVILVVTFFLVSCSNKENTKCLTEKEVSRVVNRINSNFNIELPKSPNPSPNDNGFTKVFITKDNQYCIGENNTAIINKEELESNILKNIGIDSTVELFGDKESQLDYTIFVLDVVKKHGLKVIIKTNL